MTQNDTAITVFETKYFYRFWRPSTAIRWLGGDGNRATVPDPEWLPFLQTPPYPDYVCGLPTVAGASLEVLRRFFGTDASVHVHRENAPRSVARTEGALPPRDHRSLRHVAGPVRMRARRLRGMHFRTGAWWRAPGQKVART